MCPTGESANNCATHLGTTLPHPVPGLRALLVVVDWTPLRYSLYVPDKFRLAISWVRSTR